MSNKNVTNFQKIGLYKFITTFCLIPTTDWAAIAQRAFALIQRLLIIKAILTLGKIIWSFAKTPALLGAVVFAFTFFPNTISWILVQIGQMELRVFSTIMVAILPEVFNAGASDYNSWADIWAAGINSFPTQIRDIITGLGVPELLGMVTGVFTSGSIMKIYRRILMRTM